MEQTALKDPVLAYWCDQIEAYDRKGGDWVKKGKKVVKRYKDERGEGQKKLSRYNILWSNVQTLHPAIYASPPKPNVDRRFQDDDELGATVAQVLERSVSYFVQEDGFDDALNQVVLDRLLPGRGTAWVRYVPNFVDATVEGSDEIRQEGTQATDDVQIGEEATPELYSEEVILDYVHWEDYGHTLGRTWQEVRAVWRKVPMSRRELADRFGEEMAAAVPMDATEYGKEDDETAKEGKRAIIYELWDKVSKKAYWFHKTMNGFLDTRDDPLRLKGFFPCPKPFFATLANDCLFPVPDYHLYQDQALELDVLTGRIDALVRALKVVGVYDASAEGVQRLLSQNVDNTLIPVNNWAMFSEKGGLANVINFFPLDMVAKTLADLYAAREAAKQVIYEITGISDIVRGATKANETATAQQIKGQFATLRLDNMQKEAARFARDVVAMMAEIIAEHFSVETLKKISGIRLLDPEEKAMLQQMQQMGQPIPEEVEKLLQKPDWSQVEQVLRDDMERCFRIDIETDSTIKADQEAEKAARVEFLSAAGGFIQQMGQIRPEFLPLAMQMLMFGVRGFKIGREMESDFKMTLDKMRQAAENPSPPPPDPMVEIKQQEMGLKQEELQADTMLRQQELGIKAQEVQNQTAETAFMMQQPYIF